MFRILCLAVENYLAKSKDGQFGVADEDNSQGSKHFRHESVVYFYSFLYHGIHVLSLSGWWTCRYVDGFIYQDAY